MAVIHDVAPDNEVVILITLKLLQLDDRQIVFRANHQWIRVGNGIEKQQHKDAQWKILLFIKGDWVSWNSYAIMNKYEQCASKKTNKLAKYMVQT